MKVVLASKSPRRRELLHAIYDNFDIITAECDETLPPEISVTDGVRLLAEKKGLAAEPLCDEECLIISSDTLVEIDGIPLGKPESDEDAVNMLKGLSGKRHFVHTGVAVRYRGKVASGVDSTAVYFKKLTDEEITEYVIGGEPRDKAGAYAIQGDGGKFVEKISGDFDTVVGLSVKLTRKLIDEVLNA